MDQQEWGFAAAPLGLVGLDVDALGLDEDLVAFDGLDHVCSTLQWMKNHAGQQLGIEIR